MAGGEPRLGTTATYVRHNDHGATHLSTKIDRLHDRLDNEYEVFSAGSVKKWSKFGLAARRLRARRDGSSGAGPVSRAREAVLRRACPGARSRFAARPERHRRARPR